jgi:hypothetical protein
VRISESEVQNLQKRVTSVWRSADEVPDEVPDKVYSQGEKGIRSPESVLRVVFNVSDTFVALGVESRSPDEVPGGTPLPFNKDNSTTS